MNSRALDQLTVLRGLETAGNAASRLRSTLEVIRQAIPSTDAALRIAAADYVQILAMKFARRIIRSLPVAPSNS